MNMRDAYKDLTNKVPSIDRPTQVVPITRVV